jgi:hypothetical protein
MKYVIVLISIAYTSVALSANSMVFVCSAEDSLGRQSELSFEIEAKVVSLKSLDNSTADAEIVYDSKTSCALKVGSRENCLA